MNRHITEQVPRDDLPPDFMPTDAPDPRVAVLGYEADIPSLAAVPLQDTAAITCAILMKDHERWHAGLAFEQYYVSEEWIEHLFSTLQGADLMELAAILQERAEPNGPLLLGVKPLELALAIEVWRAGKREVHLVCAPGHEPQSWRGLLDGVLAGQSQDRFCSTLTYLEAFQGDIDAADWMAENFTLHLAEAR